MTALLSAHDKALKALLRDDSLTTSAFQPFCYALKEFTYVWNCLTPAKFKVPNPSPPVFMLAVQPSPSMLAAITPVTPKAATYVKRTF